MANSVDPALDDSTEELSMPSRIGRFNRPSATSATAETDYRSMLTEDEDSRLTEGERSEWKAKYDDLSKKREGFPGAATYAYGGVFAWSMYSTAEAKDESGTIYTEYLMRCQWGPDWDTMQPWIVARRFREFVSLDGDVRSVLGPTAEPSSAAATTRPALDAALPELPTRFVSLFGGDNMDRAVVQDRREKLEEYFSVMVTRCPHVLKSKCVDRFLGISERCKAIRSQLAKEKKSEAPTEQSGGRNSEDSLEQSFNEGTALTDFSYGKGVDDIARGDTIAPGTVAELKRDGEDQKGPEFSTFEKASELVRTLFSTDSAASSVTDTTPTLDSVGVGTLEEHIVELARMQRSLSSKRYLLSVRAQALLGELNRNWPLIKRASTMNEDGVAVGVDPALIGRAMQIDEDLTLLSGNYCSIHAAVATAANRSVR